MQLCTFLPVLYLCQPQTPNITPRSAEKIKCISSSKSKEGVKLMIKLLPSENKSNWSQVICFLTSNCSDQFLKLSQSDNYLYRPLCVHVLSLGASRRFRNNQDCLTVSLQTNHHFWLGRKNTLYNILIFTACQGSSRLNLVKIHFQIYSTSFPFTFDFVKCYLF